MKYFAKYLPVEGEIKEGDWITDGKFNTGKCLQRDSEFLECSCFYGMTDVVNWRKVKLFLCSKDIQIGDKAIYNNKEVVINGYDERFLIWEFEGMPAPVNYNKELLLKVIGEISPNAIWVKEGDKFEHSDLLAAGHGVNWSDKSDDVGKFKFKVLCQNCKTFH